MTNTAHLFFSYAHADDKRMIPLHARMQAAVGHNLWIDKVGLTRGIEWEESIHRAIDDSYGVLFAITRDFVDAKRVFIRDKEIPWTIDRFRKVQGPVIFPILFEDVPLPPDLEKALHDKDLQYLFHVLDFRDGDEKRLFAELKAVLPAPVAGNHPFIIDWPRLPNFQGRDQLLIDLHDKLRGGSVGIHTIAGLHGMGGIGKTQLAIEYAHRYRFHYPAGVYWVNAARADWTAEVAEIAERLGLQPSDESGRREALLANAFERHLKDLGGDALVILDNVENPADVPNRIIGSKLRFTDLPARLLITTRRQDLPAAFAALSVNLLPPGDARALLLDARPDALDDPAIDAICKALGYLPLALGLAAAALKKRAAMKPAAFLTHLREKGVDAIARQLHLSPGDLGAPEDYVILLDAALDWHWEQIGEDARHLIALAAAYGEAAELPLARLCILSGLPDDPDDLDQPFSDAVTELRAASLIESLGGNAIRLHPLVREYVHRAAPDFPDQLDAGAERLLTAYRTPQTIYDQSALRGFGALITDLQDTLSTLSDVSVGAHRAAPSVGTRYIVSDDTKQALSALARLFDWEGHHLRAWKPESPPVGAHRDAPSNSYLIQSIRERAHHQSDDALRDACDAWLMPYSHFRSADAYRFPHDPALIRIFEGHEDAVNDVAFLPGGQQALSASSDTTLRLWDVATGSEIRRFEGHTLGVNAVSLLPGGQRALSASSDTTLRLWDVATGSEIRRFEGHTDWVRAVSLLPGGQQALSASDDKTLRLWDVATGSQIRIFEGHTSGVTAVSLLPGGQQALSASDDKTLRLWDVATGSQIRRFEGHTSGVNAVSLLPGGQQALSASDDKTLRLWDVATGSQIRRFEGHTSGVNAVSLLPGGQRALSASSDKTLRLWDVATGSQIRRFEGHTSGVNAVSLLPGGQRALSASSDTTLRLWDVATGSQIRRFEGHTHWVNAVSLLPGGQRALSASSDTTLRLWDVATGSQIRRFEGHTHWVNAVSLLPGGQRALSASSDKTLRLWDVATGSQIRRFEGHTSGVNAVSLLPGGQRALSAAWDNTLRLWDVATGSEIRRFEGHTDWVNAVSLLPGGQRALSASYDTTLRLWDVATGSQIRRFEGHTDWVNAVSLLPGGQRALSASYDTTLRLWDVATGSEIRRFEGHTSYVTAVSLLPGGQRALSASYDTTLRLWDINSGLCLAVLRLEERPTSLAVIPPSPVGTHRDAPAAAPSPRPEGELPGGEDASVGAHRDTPAAASSPRPEGELPGGEDAS